MVSSSALFVLYLLMKTCVDFDFDADVLYKYFLQFSNYFIIMPMYL